MLTLLEARVETGKEAALMEAYKQAVRELDPGIVRTYLVRGLSDSELWRILTFWENKEVLEAMRGKGTPRGVLIFREAGAEPALSMLEVVAASA